MNFFLELSNTTFESLSTSSRIVCVKVNFVFHRKIRWRKKHCAWHCWTWRNAFLLVPQQETMYVQIPTNSILDYCKGSNALLLKRCLPGLPGQLLFGGMLRQGADATAKKNHPPPAWSWYDFFANLFCECVLVTSAVRRYITFSRSLSTTKCLLQSTYQRCQNLPTSCSMRSKIAYGHYEDPLPELAASRLPRVL